MDYVQRLLTGLALAICTPVFMLCVGVVIEELTKKRRRLR